MLHGLIVLLTLIANFEGTQTLQKGKFQNMTIVIFEALPMLIRNTVITWKPFLPILNIGVDTGLTLYCCQMQLDTGQ